MCDVRDTIVIAHAYAMQSADAATMDALQIRPALSDDVELFMGTLGTVQIRECVDQCSECGCSIYQSDTHKQSILVARGMTLSWKPACRFVVSSRIHQVRIRCGVDAVLPILAPMTQKDKPHSRYATILLRLKVGTAGRAVAFDDEVSFHHIHTLTSYQQSSTIAL